MLVQPQVASTPRRGPAGAPPGLDRSGYAYARFAGGLVVTRAGWPGARWLNAVAALAWLAPDGLSGDQVAAQIAASTGVGSEQVAADLAAHAVRTRADLFFGPDTSATLPAPAPVDPVWTRVVRLGEHPVRLVVRDAAIAASLATRLVESEPSTAPVPEIELDGDGICWEVRRDGIVLHRGTHAAQARSTLLVEAARASRPDREVLAWLHAGAVEIGGNAVVLCGAGGRGKSTLTAALVASGRRLLSDDLVPLDALTLRTTGIRMPLSLRPGGLAAVRARLPGQADLRSHDHDGEPLTLWQPAPVQLVPRDAALPVAALLFPAFTPGSEARVRPLSPLERLEALVASWSSMPRTSTRLVRFVTWLESVPAWRLNYPDLDSGLRLVEAVAR